MSEIVFSEGEYTENTIVILNNCHVIGIKFYQKNTTMPKKITPDQNKANQQNKNKGTKGTNKQYDQAQGNRGKQKNPNQK